MEDAKTRLTEELRYRPTGERLDANQLVDNFRRGLQRLRPVAAQIAEQHLEQFPLERKPPKAPNPPHK